MPKPWKVQVNDDEVVIDIIGLPTGSECLILRPDVLGISIIWPSIDLMPIAFLDYWNSADPRRCAWDRPPLVMQILSPKQTDDPMAFVEFYRGQTVVAFDTMVQMEEDPECDETSFISDKVFGYFGMPNWHTEETNV